MARLVPIEVYAADLPELRDMLTRLTAERDRARDLAARLEDELADAEDALDAARGEIARLSASEASVAAAARQNTAGLR